MSIFTVAECDEAISALKCRLIDDPGGSMGSVSIAGRTVSYRSAEDLEKLVGFWDRQKTLAAASAAGRGRTSVKVARFA